MAKFYSTIQGSAGEATRRGTASSGIRASVQSYDGSVITSLESKGDEIILSIDTSDDSRSSFGNRQFRGTIKEFNEMCDLYKKIKSGEVKIARQANL